MMPRGGHNKKSVEEHKIAGTYRADRHRPARPVPRGTLPPPPKWLPAAGKHLWRTIAPLLEDRGGVTEADAPALALLCLHWSLAKTAAEALAREGLVIPDPDHPAAGGPALRKHPLHQVLRDHSAAFRGYAERFGLLPSARPEAPAEDPAAAMSEFQKYLERGRRLRAERAEAARRRAAGGGSGA